MEIAVVILLLCGVGWLWFGVSCRHYDEGFADGFQLGLHHAMQSMEEMGLVTDPEPETNIQ